MFSELSREQEMADKQSSNRGIKIVHERIKEINIRWFLSQPCN